jgi:transposase
MYYVGIDIAKRSHCLAVVDRGGAKLLSHFTVSNDITGFREVIEALSSVGVTHKNSKVAIEATGHYGTNLTAYLIDYGFEVCIVNPILTRQFQKAQSVRKVKNDAFDSMSLAKWLRFENPPASKLPSPEVLELKRLARFRTFQSQSISEAKNKVIAILDQIFPEYEKIFSDIFGKASMAVLLHYKTPQALSHACVCELTRLLKEKSGNKLGQTKALMLKESAQSSIGLDDANSFSLELECLLEQICNIQKAMKKIDVRLEELLGQSQTTIKTIPGIGTVCAGTILGEIGDIERFSKPSKLVAYAGLDSTVHQSGEFTGSKNRLSKRGSRYLRWALYMAADSARKYDPHLSEYYAKKRSEGKSHRSAVCAIARKLCNIIYALLKSGEVYVCPTK